MGSRVRPEELDANYRNKNFEEVTKNLTKEKAIEEAKRCLDDDEKKIVDARKKHLRTLKYGRIPALFIKDDEDELKAAD